MPVLRSHILVSVDRTMTEMCKAGFQDPEESFMEVDPMLYYELRFYSHIARHWNPALERQYLFMLNK